MVELDVQRTALRTNGYRLIQPAVLQAEVVEEPQRLAGEPAELVVVALGLQLADHHQRNDDFVLGEPGKRPRIGEKYGGVENIRPRVRFGHWRS